MNWINKILNSTVCCSDCITSGKWTSEKPNIVEIRDDHKAFKHKCSQCGSITQIEDCGFSPIGKPATVARISVPLFYQELTAGSFINRSFKDIDIDNHNATLD